MAIQAAFQEMGVFQNSVTRVPNLEDAIPFGTMPTVIASRPDGPLEGEGESNNLAQLQHELEIILAAEIARKEISMGRELDGLVISLREAGFFESGSAQMKQSSAPAFDRIAALLRKRKCRLRIEGHTDNIPIHNAKFSSNWELSTSRATEIVRLLIVRDGFDAYHLSAAGYAEYHPEASNGTAEGRGQNRRVDIVILSEGPPAAASEGAQESVPVASGANPLQ